LAVVDRALQNGIPFTGQQSLYFRHDSLPQDARSWGILDHDGAEELEILRALRIAADYSEDQVGLEEASVAYDAGARLMTRLLGDGGVA
jgi:hypothetical protein